MLQSDEKKKYPDKRQSGKWRSLYVSILEIQRKGSKNVQEQLKKLSYANY